MKNYSYIVPHLALFFVVMVWGSSFVFTKILLNAGLTAAQIFLLRFAISYVVLLTYSVFKKSHRWFARNWTDELKMVGLGITGGSLYFLAENSAMNYTSAINTSIIVNACPLFTALLVGFVYKSERISAHQMTGTVLSLVGMAIVVLNGRFMLHLSPKGDLLAFVACMSWVVYSLIMVKMSKQYDSLFITRKVFFYGVLTILPYFIIDPGMPSLSLLVRTDVVLNLVYLSVISSVACFLLWNWAINKLGVVITTNYIYLNSPSTILFAWWLIDETVTPWVLLGTLLLIYGLYMINQKKKTLPVRQ